MTTKTREVTLRSRIKAFFEDFPEASLSVAQACEKWNVKPSAVTERASQMRKVGELGPGPEIRLPTHRDAQRPRVSSKPSGIKNKVWEMASRPEGMTTKDLPDLSSNSVGSAAWAMTERGQLFTIKSGNGNRWFTSKEARDAYALQHLTRLEKVDRKPTLIIRQPHGLGKAQWTKDTPPHLPYDDAGRPLFKVTVCPGFTGNPVRTNTHSGAY